MLEETSGKVDKISKGTKTLDLMVTTFIDFMESAYMGNTTLPIIKLFSIRLKSPRFIFVYTAINLIFLEF